ncbi:MAG: protease modulator HflC [Candidatus Marinimicrobia bacterium]|jgi:membrane protease subunit HflC|nr:protease modulator HflC [Candidatus Neomarinimicrobiota bacterium]MBT3962308.1 protease modulator HflC [Candidatus Neomarinimicrobiota bacterium]MBT4635168.1 protease modulator HflC [Candidatus Neomarinimicrobiota bacterium]MBT4686180.1 protease modulator HflC [Candidatus Neomarinimicrobiota bacterium]MBT6937436.1 protease modulator HflC [Candidatus Neomarinimicrobiota bacterium]
MKKNILIFIIVLGTLFAFSTVFMVDETEQVVILQFGKPVRTITEPGLNFKLPAPFQTASSFDNRLLEYDVPPEEILSKDKKSLIVDNYVRFRIVNPLLFLQTVQSVPIAVTRLDDIVYSKLRQELGTHEMAEIITENRDVIMEIVTRESDEATNPYGIQVVDVRIKRVDLPQENEKSIYARMEAERMRQANKFRSEGEEEAQKIRASTDKDKVVILADAYKTAQEIRGVGEAKALEIYATAFSKDPDFYEFIRTLETYKKVIDNKTTLVLPSDSKLFKTLTD